MQILPQRLRALARFAPLVILAALPARADMMLTVKASSDRPALLGNNVDRQERKVTMWIGAGRVRRDDEGQSAYILLYSEKKLYIVDHQDKSYTVLDLPVDLAKLVPGEQGDALKKELSGGSKMDVSIKDTGETRKIGDWNTKKYHVVLNNPALTITTDMWVTKDLGIDTRALRDMQMNLASLQPGTLDWVKKMQQIEGFPVLQETSVNYGAPKDVKTREELVSAEKKDPPAGTFEPPAGYTQKPFTLTQGAAGKPAPPPAAPAPPR